MALRVVTGDTAIVADQQAFTTVFTNKSVTGSVDSHILTVDEMPTHSHGITDTGHTHACTVSNDEHSHNARYGVRGDSSKGGGGNNEIIGGNVFTSTASTNVAVSADSNTTGISAQTNGSSTGHSHGFSGGVVDLQINYVDVIIASKN